MSDFLPFIWVLIPLAAILVGAFSEYLKFKAKQQQLGASTHDLAGEVASLRKQLTEAESEREGFRKRLQNLEAIVTSTSYDALEAPKPRIELPDENDEAEAMRRAEQMARRLNGY